MRSIRPTAIASSVQGQPRWASVTRSAGVVAQRLEEGRPAEAARAAVDEDAAVEQQRQPQPARLGEHRLHGGVVRVPAGRHHLHAAQAERLDGAPQVVGGAAGRAGRPRRSRPGGRAWPRTSAREVRVGAPQRGRVVERDSRRSGTAPAARRCRRPPRPASAARRRCVSPPVQCRWASMIIASRRAARAACGARDRAPASAESAHVGARAAPVAPGTAAIAAAMRRARVVPRRGWPRVPPSAPARAVGARAGSRPAPSRRPRTKRRRVVGDRAPASPYSDDHVADRRADDRLAARPCTRASWSG